MKTILCVALALAHSATALKCYAFNEVDPPWERLKRHETAYVEECEDPIAASRSHFPDDELTEEEMVQMKAMKRVCVKTFLTMDQSPNTTLYRGYCSYYKRYVSDPCRQLERNVQTAMGLSVGHCSMCSTDLCNFGDVEDLEY